MSDVRQDLTVEQAEYRMAHGEPVFARHPYWPEAEYRFPLRVARMWPLRNPGDRRLVLTTCGQNFHTEALFAHDFRTLDNIIRGRTVRAGAGT